MCFKYLDKLYDKFSEKGLGKINWYRLKCLSQDLYEIMKEHEELKKSLSLIIEDCDTNRKFHDALKKYHYMAEKMIGEQHKKLDIVDYAMKLIRQENKVEYKIFEENKPEKQEVYFKLRYDNEGNIILGACDKEGKNVQFIGDILVILKTGVIRMVHGVSERTGLSIESGHVKVVFKGA